MRIILLTLISFLLSSCIAEDVVKSVSGDSKTTELSDTKKSAGGVTEVVVAPKILKVFIPANRTYKANEALIFRVEFSGPVTVLNTPRIGLDLAGNIKYANYLSGSGTKNLLFSYRPAIGDNFSGVYTFKSPLEIDLNSSGIISSLGGTSALLKFLPPNLSLAFAIDTTAPIVSVNPPSASLVGPSITSVDIDFSISGANNISISSSHISLIKTGNANASISVTGGTTPNVKVTLSSITGEGTLKVKLIEGRAWDSVGNLAGGKTSNSITIENIPPFPIGGKAWFVNLSDSDGDDISVAWDLFSDANLSEYELFTYTDSNCSSGEVNHGKTGNTLTTNASMIDGLSNGTYYFKVKAYDLADNWSLSSCSFNSLLVDNSVPVDNTANAQFIFQYDNDGNDIRMNWTAFSPSTSGLKEYIIKLYSNSSCSASPSYSFNTSLPLAIDNYVVDGVTDGIYNATITAVDNANHSATSACSTDSIQVDTLPPSQATPNILFTDTIDSDANNIRMTWNSYSDSGTGMADYRIDLFTNNTCSGASIFTALTGSSNTGDNGVIDGLNDGTYYATVTAFDNSGLSTTSSCSTDFISVDATAPLDVIANFTFTNIGDVDGNNIAVSWNAFVDLNLVDHRLYTYTDEFCVQNEIDHGPTGSASNADSTNIDSLADGRYYGVVRAIDVAGNFTDSACSTDSIWVDSILPVDNGANLQFADGYDPGGNNISVSWVSFTDTNLSDHQLFTYTDAGCTSNEVDHGNTGNSLSNNADLIDGLNSGQYWGKVKAIDIAGQSVTSACSTDNIIIDKVAPVDATGTGLVFVNAGNLTGNNLVVNWTAFTDASSGIGNHTIELYTLNSCTGSPIFSFVTNSTGTTDNSVVDGVAIGTYYGKVIGFDRAGNSISSGCSTDSIIVGDTGTWPFTTPGDYVLSNSDQLFFDTGVLKLHEITKDDNNNSLGFAGGVHFGSVWDTTLLKLDLSAIAAIELDSSWTPKWSNLVSNWKFNNDPLDAKGSFDASLGPSAPTFSATSKLGSHSLNFDGIDDGATVAHNVAISPTSAITFSSWVKSSQIGSSYPDNGMVLSKFNTNSETYALYVNSLLNKFVCSVRLNGSEATLRFIQSDNSVDTNWHHIVCTYEGNVLKMYVDSILQSDQLSISGSLDSDSGGLLGFGHSPTIDNQLFFGLIDDVALWNVALEQVEVDKIYKKQLPYYVGEHFADWTPSYNQMVANWKFNNTLVNIKGENDGVASGASAPTFSTTAKLGSHSSNFLGGADDRLTISSSNLFNIPNGTISLWMKSDGTWATTGGDASDRAILFGRHDASTSCSGLSLVIDPADGHLEAIMKNSACGASFTVATTGHNVLDDNWHLITLLFSQNNGGINKIFIDGIERGSLNSTTAWNFNSQDLIIGDGLDTDWEEYKGLIDDLSIWNQQLTVGNIKHIYDRSSPLYKGEFESRIVDASSDIDWLGLNWAPTLPFYKELPDAGNNELSSDYTSLANSTLMDNIVALYHMNESSWSGVLDEVLDNSGNANHSTRFGQASTTSDGKFLNAGTFDGSGDYASTTTRISTSLDDISFSGWVNWGGTTGSDEVIFYNGTKAADGYGLVLDNTDSDNIHIILGSSFDYDTGITLVEGAWTHLAFTRDSGTWTFFVNGLSINISTPAGLPVAPTGITFIGGSASEGFLGKIDEIAFWERAISSAEVLQLYRRGANRIKFQMRSCNDQSCIGESWVGPDNTNQTYFSELYNYQTITSGVVSGNVLSALPNMLYADFPANSGMIDNQFIQYRVILESDDANTLCTTACVPEIKSNSHSPILYPLDNPTVTTKLVEAQAYSFLGDFTAVTGGACTLKYQLSRDGTNYYYHNGTSWTLTTLLNQNNNSSEVNLNIPLFHIDVGTGSLYFKIIFENDGTQSCNIDNIDVNLLR